MTLSTRRVSFSILLFLGVVTLRTLQPTADPPGYIDWSGGLFFDEGALAHNARNRVIFSRWQTDEWNDFYYSPILTLLKYFVFQLWGVGYIQLRALFITFAAAILLLTWFHVRRSYEYPFNLLILALLGFSYFFAMFNRLGLTETPLTFFMLLSFLLWEKSADNRIDFRPIRRFVWALGSGIVAWIAFTVKSYILFFLPVPLIAAYLAGIQRGNPLENPLRRARWPIIGGYGAGLLFGGTVWYFAFFHKYYEYFNKQTNFVKNLSMPHNLYDIFHNVLYNSFFNAFSSDPIFALLSLLGLLVLFYHWLYQRERVEPFELFMLLWFLFEFSFLSVWSYRPHRYFVSMVLPMAYLSVYFLRTVFKTQAPTWNHATQWSFRVVLFLLFLFILVYWLIPMGWKAFTGLRFVSKRIPPLVLWTMGFINAVFLTGFIGSSRFLKIIHHYPILSRKIIRIGTVFLLCLSFILNGKEWIQWFSHPTYSIPSISRDLAQQLPPGSYVAGLATPELLLPTPIPALYVWENFANDENPFGKYPLTHMLLADFNGERSFYQTHYPNVMAHSRLINTYRIRGSRFYLYSIHNVRLVDVDMTVEEHGNLPFIKLLGTVFNNKKESVYTEIITVLYPTNGDFNQQPISTHRMTVSVPPGQSGWFKGTYPLPKLQTSYDVLVYDRDFLEKIRFEGEELGRQIGTSRYNRKASSFQVRFAQPGKEGFIAYGPYHKFPPGIYSVSFAVGVYSRPISQNMAVMQVDITTDIGRTTIAKQNVFLTPELISSGKMIIPFHFYLPEEKALEFRVYSLGKVPVYVDYVDVAYYRALVGRVGPSSMN